MIKKTLKILGLGLVSLLALALILNAYAVAQTGKTLQDRLKKLREAGHPVTLSDLAAKPITADQNVAVILLSIRPEVQAMAKEMAPVLNAESERGKWTDDDRKTMEAAFAHHPEVLPALKEAAGKPKYQSQLNHAQSTSDFIGALLPHVQVQRQVTQILKAQMQLQLLRKDRDGAMQTCLTSLRLSRHSQGEPMMISYLVAIATRAVSIDMVNRVLRDGPLPAELHRELDAEMAKFDSPDGFRQMLKSERTFGLQGFDEQLPLGWFTRAYVNDEKSYYLDLMETWIGQGDMTYADFQKYEKETKAEAGGVRHRLTKMLVPAVLKVREAEFRSRCQVRCLRVLNALIAQKVADVPTKLTDLKLPAATILDPYTDKPLIVKKINGQWIVYGLGPNLKDDGGEFEKLEDIGLGPVKKEK